MSDFEYNGVSLGYTNGTFGETIVDSGTTELNLPDAIYQSIVNSLQQNTVFTQAFSNHYFTDGYCVPINNGVSNSTLNLLPNITVVLGSSNQVYLTLSGVNSYIQAVANPNGHTYYCPGISSGSPTILGWSVMNQYIVVFDKANSRVGFGKPIACGITPNTTNSTVPTAPTNPNSTNTTNTTNPNNNTHSGGYSRLSGLNGISQNIVIGLVVGSLSILLLQWSSPQYENVPEEFT